MNEISFTGSIGYITYLVEKYEKEGYEITNYLQKNNIKFGPLVSVTMTKKQTNPGEVIIYVNGEPISCTTSMDYKITTRTWEPQGVSPLKKLKSLEQQLTDALDREDYETAAILRDKINSL
jgi:hypothetical protein